MNTIVKVDYVTHLVWGKHKAGSKCKAWRDGPFLILEFDDGDIIRLDGTRYRLGGVEYWSIAEEMDREILAELDAIIFREFEE